MTKARCTSINGVTTVYTSVYMCMHWKMITANYRWREMWVNDKQESDCPQNLSPPKSKLCLPRKRVDMTGFHFQTIHTQLVNGTHPPVRWQALRILFVLTHCSLQSLQYFRGFLYCIVLFLIIIIIESNFPRGKPREIYIKESSSLGLMGGSVS